jgi:hypothetical protein
MYLLGKVRAQRAASHTHDSKLELWEAIVPMPG